MTGTGRGRRERTFPAREVRGTVTGSVARTRGTAVTYRTGSGTGCACAVIPVVAAWTVVVAIVPVVVAGTIAVVTGTVAMVSAVRTVMVAVVPAVVAGTVVIAMVAAVGTVVVASAGTISIRTIPAVGTVVVASVRSVVITAVGAVTVAAAGTACGVHGPMRGLAAACRGVAVDGTRFLRTSPLCAGTSVVAGTLACAVRIAAALG